MCVALAGPGERAVLVLLTHLPRHRVGTPLEPSSTVRQALLGPGLRTPAGGGSQLWSLPPT